MDDVGEQSGTEGVSEEAGPPSRLRWRTPWRVAVLLALPCLLLVIWFFWQSWSGQPMVEPLVRSSHAGGNPEAGAGSRNGGVDGDLESPDGAQLLIVHVAGAVKNPGCSGCPPVRGYSTRSPQLVVRIRLPSLTASTLPPSWRTRRRLLSSTAGGGCCRQLAGPVLAVRAGGSRGNRDFWRWKLQPRYRDGRGARRLAQGRPRPGQTHCRMAAAARPLAALPSRTSMPSMMVLVPR